VVDWCRSGYVMLGLELWWIGVGQVRLGLELWWIGVGQVRLVLELWWIGVGQVMLGLELWWIGVGQVRLECGRTLVSLGSSSAGARHGPTSSFSAIVSMMKSRHIQSPRVPKSVNAWRDAR